MEIKKIGLAPPWVIYSNEIEALFRDDPEIRVEYNDDEKEVKLYVENQEKADALTKLLPSTQSFGNIVLKITIVPANVLEDSKVKLFQVAFEGNPAFSYSRSIEGILSNPIHYIVFKKKVVQYYDDDIGDINGICSTLYQDIAKDVFGDVEGVFFCTDIND